MALKAPLTWNDNVPAVSAPDPEPLYRKGAYAEESRVAEEWQSAGQTVFKTGMLVQDAVTKAETDANRQYALDASVEFDKKVNEAHAVFKTFQGMDAVKAQAQFSQKVYEERQRMGGSLPNRQAQDFFLARTAEAAVSTDRAIQLHAADEWNTHQRSQMMAKYQGLLERAVALSPDDRTGTRLNILGELAENGEEQARLMGMTDPESIRRAQNIAAADGAAAMITELLRTRNGAALNSLLEELTKNEDSKGIMGALVLKHSDTMRAAEAWVLDKRISGAVENVIKANPLVVQVGPGRGQAYPSANAVDYAGAMRMLEATRAKGLDPTGKEGFRDDMEYEAAKAKLQAMSSVASNAWGNEVAQHVTAVWGAHGATLDRGGGPGAAMEAARNGPGSADWMWLQTYAPATLTVMRRTMQGQVDAAAYRATTRSGRTDDQQAYLLHLNDMINDDPGLLVQAPEEQFKAMIAPLSRADQFRKIEERRKASQALANGRAAPAWLPGAFRKWASEWDAASYPPGVPMAQWNDEGAKSRYSLAEDALYGWAEEFVEREKRDPNPEELQTQARIYLQEMDLPWNPRTQSIPQRIKADGGFAKPEDVFDQGEASWSALQDAKQMWLAQEQNRILRRGHIPWKGGRVGDPKAIQPGWTPDADTAVRYYHLLDVAGPSAASKFLAEEAEKAWQRQFSRLPHKKLSIQVAAPIGASASLPGAPTTPLDAAYLGTPNLGRMAPPVPTVYDVEPPAEVAPAEASDGSD